MNNLYIEILTQWILFLAIIAVLPISAFRFRKIARNNKKKGWPHFLLGLAAGFFAFICVLLVFAVIRYVSPHLSKNYSGIILLLAIAIEYIAMIFLIRIFKRRFPKVKPLTTTLDGEFIDETPR